MADAEVQRMVLALVYQMEALVDELASRGLIDRAALAARVEGLVRRANAVADEAMELQRESRRGAGGGSDA
jgi:hypothetical protein